MQETQVFPEAQLKIANMHSLGSHNRLSVLAFHSRILGFLLLMMATLASVYVAGRLWLDAEDRLYVIKELDRRSGQGRLTVSVDDTLKIITCKNQQKRLSSIKAELAKARHEGFIGRLPRQQEAVHGNKLLAVVGIITSLGHKNSREAIRKSWVPTGAARKKLKDDKGIIIRFVVGRSASLEDNLDRAVDSENKQTNDFIILENHVETMKALPKKMKLFFVYAVDAWDSEFYVKVNDDIKVSLDALGTMLASHLDKPKVYIGCMKSGEVFSDMYDKWYEPDWWKFGDGKSYFRHASGDMFVISRALGIFISINRAALRTYAHDDVSAGSWFIGLDVEYVNEEKFCCSSSWISGAICAAA